MSLRGKCWFAVSKGDEGPDVGRLGTIVCSGSWLRFDDPPLAVPLLVFELRLEFEDGVEFGLFI